MHIKRSLLVCGCIGSAITAQADFQLIDNFEGDLSAWYFSDPNQNCESFEPNFCDGVREIIEDPILGGGNKVGKFKAANDNVTTNWTAVNAIALPQTASGTYTFYMKYAVADWRMNNVFGLMSEQAEFVTNAYDDYESIIGIRTVDGGRVVVRDFDVYVVASADPVEILTWYEMWLVHDDANLTYDVWIKGGDEFPEQTLVWDDALYRKGQAEAAAFAILIGTGPSDQPDGNSDFYIDDLHIDYDGENLDSPSGNTGGGDKWAGWDMLPSGDVDTGSFMSWINVVNDPWIWVYSLNKFIYLPEANVGAQGGWTYIPGN